MSGRPVARWLRAAIASRHRRRLLAAWWALGPVELLLAAGDVAPPAAWQMGLEVAGGCVIGLAHARRAPDDWRGSTAWPGVVLMLAALRSLGPGYAHVPLSLGWIALAVVLGGVLAALVVRALHRPVLSRLPAIAPTAAGAAVARLLFLMGSPAALLHPAGALVDEARAVLPHGADGRPPLVVITVDTWRADAAARSRTLRWMRERGSTWERAMSTSSWTLPALSSLWTGVGPDVHGAGGLSTEATRALRPDVPTLAEELAGSGYRTAAFVANPLAGTPGLGLARGFETFRLARGLRPPPLLLAGSAEVATEDDGAALVDAALRWLDTAPPDGFLLWVHLWDPHLPYRHVAAGSVLARAPLYDAAGLRDGSRPATPELRSQVRRAYAGEARYVDVQVVRLLSALERHGVTRRGCVVVTADHGEELWDHGGFEHGHSHHGEVVDVPLAVAGAGAPVGERRSLASLVDVAPTLRAVAGLPPRGLDLRGTVPQGRIARADGNRYGSDQRSLRRGDVRVIEGPSGTVRYDLRADPTERHPQVLSPDDPDAVALSGRSPAQGPLVDLGRLDALRALGYVR